MAKCSELKPGDQVVYKTHEYGRIEYQEGTVVLVTTESMCIHTCRLEGYRNRDDTIPFTDMVAKYDPDGEHMRFGSISGPSVMLEPY